MGITEKYKEKVRRDIGEPGSKINTLHKLSVEKADKAELKVANFLSRNLWFGWILHFLFLGLIVFILLVIFGVVK